MHVMHAPAGRHAALLATALAAAAAAPAALRAQLPTPLAAPGPRAGLIAGLSSATVGGSDAVFDAPAEQGLSKKRRNGFVAGGYLTFPFVAGLPISLRPELLYAQKGVKVSGSLPFDNTGTSSAPYSAATKLDYLELPVLLQLDVPNAAGLRPSVYAGPSVAYLVRCRTEATFAGSTTDEACDAQGDGPRKFDVGGVVGGQLGFALAGQAVGVGVRYTHGFTRFSEGSDVKNRALAVYGAIEIGR